MTCWRCNAEENRNEDGRCLYCGRSANRDHEEAVERMKNKIHGNIKTFGGDRNYIQERKAKREHLNWMKS